MKIAVCTFQYDSVADLNESGWEILDTKDPVIFNAYVSDSKKIGDRRVKVAIGKKNIDDLWQEHVEYLKQNEKK